MLMSTDDAAPEMESELAFDLADEAATEALARRVAKAAGRGDTIGLIGDLGTGKTVFARAFIRAVLANPDEEVPSPTFTLLQTYEADALALYHFDLYRIEDPEEALELGIEEAFADGVALIEWAERLDGLLPADRLEIRLTHGPRAGTRRARLAGFGYWRAKLIEGIGDGAIHG